MHKAFWNGLSGVRCEEAPFGPEAIRLNASGFKAKRLSVGSAPGCIV